MSPNLSLHEAAEAFALTLPPKKHLDGQEALKFARWYGEDKAAAALRPIDIQLYVETFGLHSPLASARAESLKAFLAFADKNGITSTRLVSHVRVHRPAGSRRAAEARTARENEEVRMTADGQAAFQAELDELISQRPRIAEELHQARSEGDVSEDASLDAVRESQGKLEGRIRELETILRMAVVIENDESAAMAQIAHVGSNIVISNLTTGTKLEYQIVNPSEARGGAGRLSYNSPVGHAIVGHRVGDMVEVNAPGGVIRYRIESLKA